MKKLLIGFAATAILSISCSKAEKEAVIEDEKISVDVKKVEEVLSFEGHPGSRVTVFNILNPAEKAYAFKKHIQENYQKLDLNEKKKS